MTDKKHKEEEKSIAQDFLDPAFPLLQKFKDGCPGTWKHSQNVKDMVSTIAQKLGLDVEKMELAATYHDIGKICNAKVFSENQREDHSIHEDLQPEISVQLITRHVSDSVMILINVDEFPRDVIKIISEHHGNTLVKYFFDRAKTKKEDDFRYQTNRPSSSEALVLMLCDCVEATAQAIVYNGGKVDPENVVEETETRLMVDHQLDELKVGQLQTIKALLIKELEGIFPKRVDYEDGGKTKNGEG